jgi:hypothetical protein
MSNRDRTGPEGKGPMTGRGAVDCAGQPSWGYAGRTRSWRTGGRGRRLPRWTRVGPAPAWREPIQEQETEALKAQAEQLRCVVCTTWNGSWPRPTLSACPYRWRSTRPNLSAIRDTALWKAALFRPNDHHKWIGSRRRTYSLVSRYSSTSSPVRV